MAVCQFEIMIIMMRELTAYMPGTSLLLSWTCKTLNRIKIIDVDDQLRLKVTRLFMLESAALDTEQKKPYGAARPSIRLLKWLITNRMIIAGKICDKFEELMVARQANFDVPLMNELIKLGLVNLHHVPWLFMAVARPDNYEDCLLCHNKFTKFIRLHLETLIEEIGRLMMIPSTTHEKFLLISALLSKNSTDIDEGIMILRRFLALYKNASPYCIYNLHLTLDDLVRYGAESLHILQLTNEASIAWSPAR